MSTIEHIIDSCKFNRARTLGLLDRIEKMSDPNAALAWRPGDGRAHVAWQIMHVGVTEEIFATERLAPEKPGAFTDLWPRFRGGSTPDDNIPTLDEIRQVLADGREHLLETLADYDDSRLDEIPAALQERGLTFLMVLHILSWHESHHHGQAHLTLNLFEAQSS